jgi:hypothetical protein
MKFLIQVLAFTAIVAIPSALMGQTPSSGFAPSSPLAQPFKEITKFDLKLLPQMPVNSGQQSSFMNHLPSLLPGKTKQIFVNDSPSDPAYYYNMPVVKPGKTSKILIAELDLNSPYTYNMPVRKLGVVEK